MRIAGWYGWIVIYAMKLFTSALALCASGLAVLAQPVPPLNPETPSTTSQAAEKPDIRELIKGAAFTNSAGMVMVKVGGIWVGRTEVTQAEYKKVTGGNPSKYRGDRNPVDGVSWAESLAFCAQLTNAEKDEEMLPEGYIYTLPTQAQWESLAASATLDQAVTSMRGNRTGPAPVGSLKPTSAGLYDLRGNVWEWTLDPQDKVYRVARGAAWDDSYEPRMRMEFRWYSTGPEDHLPTHGFRCVLVPQR